MMRVSNIARRWECVCATWCCCCWVSMLTYDDHPQQKSWRRILRLCRSTICLRTEWIDKKNENTTERRAEKSESGVRERSQRRVHTRHWLKSWLRCICEYDSVPYHRSPWFSRLDHASCLLSNNPHIYSKEKWKCQRIRVSVVDEWMNVSYFISFECECVIFFRRTCLHYSKHIVHILIVDHWDILLHLITHTNPTQVDDTRMSACDLLPLLLCCQHVSNDTSCSAISCRCCYSRLSPQMKILQPMPVARSRFHIYTQAEHKKNINRGSWEPIRWLHCICLLLLLFFVISTPHFLLWSPLSSGIVCEWGSVLCPWLAIDCLVRVVILTPVNESLFA